jgi:protein-S-isoprenylcysteine O-methyltransferase Ste14
VIIGFYAFIRHLGYLALFAIVLASGVALGSWLATLVLVVLGLPGLTVRAVMEDCMLQAELPGYRDYAARVRWRVLPGVWRRNEEGFVANCQRPRNGDQPREKYAILRRALRMR